MNLQNCVHQVWWINSHLFVADMMNINVFFAGTTSEQSVMMNLHSAASVGAVTTDLVVVVPFITNLPLFTPF